MAAINNYYNKPNSNWFDPYTSKMSVDDILDQINIKDIEKYIRKKKFKNIQNDKQ